MSRACRGACTAIALFLSSALGAVAQDASALIAETRAEIARLSAEMRREEQLLEDRRITVEARLERDETRNSVAHILDLAAGFLSTHRLVQKMNFGCRSVFSDLGRADTQVRAMQCLEDIEISEQVTGTFRCSQLDLKLDGDRFVLAGHVMSESDRRDLEARVGRVAAAAVVVSPWPVCKALEAISIPDTMESDVIVSLLSGQTRVRFGESLALEVVTPEVPSFLYLAYLQADDNVVNLLPSNGRTSNQHPPSTRLFFGDGIGGRQAYTAGAPAGPEAVIAIAARGPISELEDLEDPRDGQYRLSNGQLIGRSAFMDVVLGALHENSTTRGVVREIATDLVYIEVVE